MNKLKIHGIRHNISAYRNRKHVRAEGITTLYRQYLKEKIQETEEMNSDSCGVFLTKSIR